MAHSRHSGFSVPMPSDDATLRDVPLGPNEFRTMQVTFVPNNPGEKLAGYAMRVTELESAAGKERIVGGQTMLFGVVRGFNDRQPRVNMLVAQCAATLTQIAFRSGMGLQQRRSRSGCVPRADTRRERAISRRASVTGTWGQNTSSSPWSLLTRHQSPQERFERAESTTTR